MPCTALTVAALAKPFLGSWQFFAGFTCAAIMLALAVILIAGR
jgi:hypothetical protein